MDKPKFEYVTYIATTPAKLWEALTSPQFTAKYWFGIRWQSDCKVGSKFTMTSSDGTQLDSGEILEADPPRRLSYTFHPQHDERLLREPPSRVVFELEPMGAQVRLALTHDQFTEGSLVFEGIKIGWPKILSSLKTLLETGSALELTSAALIKKEMEATMKMAVENSGRAVELG